MDKFATQLLTIKTNKMKRSIIPSIVIIAFVAICCASCNEHPNAEKLPQVTCQAVSNLLLKITTQSGQEVFIDSKGIAYYEPRAAKYPFVISGTGCILEKSFFGTVAHINPKTFNKRSFEQMLKAAEMENDTLFIKNLASSIERMGLVAPNDESAWQYYRVNSFIIPPATSVSGIKRALESSPFKIPEECIETEVYNENEQNEIAIYQLKKNPPEGMHGFKLNDIVDDGQMKTLKQRKSHIEDVISWGYPIGIISRQSNNPNPEPDRGQVTGWPSSSVLFLQTNLHASPGSSGSFVISSDDKIIGLVIGTDSSNPNNVICTPGNLLYDMYKEALDAMK